MPGHGPGMHGGRPGGPGMHGGRPGGPGMHRGGPTPPPPHYHRPYRRGWGCSGCLMPVLGVIALIVLALSMLF